MRTILSMIIATAVHLLVLAGSILAADPKRATEDDYYRITALPVPDEINLEAGGLEWLPDGRLAVCTRRGDVYIVENPGSNKPEEIRFRFFAGGLHEPLGVVHRDGWLYVTQRGEITRIKDADGDGRADVFETVGDGWELSGDYHEYAFGSKFDKDGNIWVVLCLTGSYTSDVKYRGWCVRVAPDGKIIPTTSGIRSPGGIGTNAAGDMFFTENQGPWNGACGVKHLKPGGFVGHPAGNRWYQDPEVSRVLGPRPPEPNSNSRVTIEENRVPQLVPTAVVLPYAKMGQSAAGIVTDLSAGKFGPFAEQMFVADQAQSIVMRVFMEKVDGLYQGACFPFRQGFASGSLGLQYSPTGALYVFGTSRGWGARGPKQYSLERLEWTGNTPFEIHQMRATSDGFELTFTRPIDPATAGRVESHKLQTYTYIYQSNYGSPEVDRTHPKIQSATVGSDGRSVRLVVDKLQLGHVHELELPGIRSADGAPLLHPVGYYTMNRIPGEKK